MGEINAWGYLVSSINSLQVSWLSPPVGLFGTKIYDTLLTGRLYSLEAHDNNFVLIYV